MNYPNICSPLPLKVEVNYPHLEDLQLTDRLNDNCGAIDVLIGSDYYWEIVSGETVCGDCGPMAVSSKFGWLLSGSLRDSVTSDTVTSNLIISGDCPFASCNLERFWEAKSIGICEKKQDVIPKRKHLSVLSTMERDTKLHFPGKTIAYLFLTTTISATTG